jgi:hypothetical protein
MKKIGAIVVAGLLVASPALLEAQRSRSRPMAPRPIEYGIDAGATFGLDDPNITEIDIPARHFRVGWFANDRVSLEPQLGLHSESGGATDVTVYTFDLGLLWHFGIGRPYAGLFTRPFIGVSGFSNGTSESDPHVGIGVGMKWPFANRRFAARGEVNYAHEFADPEDRDQIGLLLGLSFFTH